MSANTQILIRTVLGSVAAWSLGTLVVVETGLGSRYSLHPDAEMDPASVPSLALQRGVQQLQAAEAYAVVAERPLFNPDRRPVPSADAPATAEATAAPLNVALTSVILMGDAKIAIVTDPASKKAQSVRLGAALAGEYAGWKLVELEPRRAVFEGSAGRSSLDLRVFDGQGGEAPTAAPVAPAGGDAAAAASSAQPAGVIQESPETAGKAETPESKAEQIRRRIEERRRQMREEAQRVQAERGQ